MNRLRGVEPIFPVNVVRPPSCTAPKQLNIPVLGNVDVADFRVIDPEGILADESTKPIYDERNICGPAQELIRKGTVYCTTRWPRPIRDDSFHIIGWDKRVLIQPDHITPLRPVSLHSGIPLRRQDVGTELYVHVADCTNFSCPYNDATPHDHLAVRATTTITRKPIPLFTDPDAPEPEE